jgi:excisionase family DNA binding protein
MNVTPDFITRLVNAPCPFPGEEILVWTSSEAEALAQSIVANAIQSMDEPYFKVDHRQIIYRIIAGDNLKQIGGSKEKGRQLIARALRRLRNRLQVGQMDKLAQAVKVEPIPNGPRDPAWMSVQQAHETTGLSRDHLRWLVRQGKIESRVHPTRRNLIQLKRESLKEYVKSPGEKGRKKRGVWKI